MFDVYDELKVNAVCNPVPSNLSTVDAVFAIPAFAINIQLFAVRSVSKADDDVWATVATYVAPLLSTKSPTAYALLAVQSPCIEYEPVFISANAPASKLSLCTDWFFILPSSC